MSWISIQISDCGARAKWLGQLCYVRPTGTSHQLELNDYDYEWVITLSEGWERHRVASSTTQKRCGTWRRKKGPGDRANTITIYNGPYVLGGVIYLFADCWFHWHIVREQRSLWCFPWINTLETSLYTIVLINWNTWWLSSCDNY